MYLNKCAFVFEHAVYGIYVTAILIYLIIEKKERFVFNLTTAVFEDVVF